MKSYLTLSLLFFIACDSNGPATTSTKASQPITEGRAIELVRNLLERRDLEVLGHDGATYLPIRFGDGSDGAFAAIGFSGPVRGYSMIGHFRPDTFEPIVFRSGDVDWGIHSLKDPRSVPAQIIKLTLAPQEGPEELIRVTGTLHQPTALDDDGYFELLRVSQKRIDVLFVGSARNEFLEAESGPTWTEHSYQFRNASSEEASKIIETRSDCHASRTTPSRSKCRDRQVIHRFDGQSFVEVK